MDVLKRGWVWGAQTPYGHFMKMIYALAYYYNNLLGTNLALHSR